MKTSKKSLCLAVVLLALSACEEEAPVAVSSETGGEASGEILGGTISDDMIPFDQLTSTSPPAERTTTTVTSSEDGTQTTVETTVTTSSDPEAPQPAPPEPPATPDEGQ
ncbi:MAG: hypothetical protein ABJ205_03185 [Erythrobacter sp.]|uniref:hypothetical protein n=1 Tax=Erythrobacter sp. TaxID=1042 RepID=UPI0032663744